LRANIVAVASNYCNCNITLAEDKEEQDDKNGSPEYKVQPHSCLKACYFHRTINNESKLYKLGEMAEDLQEKFVNCCNSIKEGLRMHKKLLLHQQAMPECMRLVLISFPGFEMRH
jgi:hypothetical protein